MDDPFQQQALGRANAACAAIFAILERFEGDQKLQGLLGAHAEIGRTALLNTRTPDVALSEFDKAILEMQHRLAKNA